MVRAVENIDLEALKEVLDSSDLFPSEMLDQMIVDYLDNPESDDIWLTTIVDNTPISIAYCAPEKMANGTYNLYAIAVHKDFQNNGIGTALIKYLEFQLQNKNARILIVETSGLDEYEKTRKFYSNLNYSEVGRIREFYDEGEDKVIFWKKLSTI